MAASRRIWRILRWDIAARHPYAEHYSSSCKALILDLPSSPLELQRSSFLQLCSHSSLAEAAEAVEDTPVRDTPKQVNFGSKWIKSKVIQSPAQTAISAQATKAVEHAPKQVKFGSKWITSKVKHLPDAKPTASLPEAVSLQSLVNSSKQALKQGGLLAEVLQQFFHAATTATPAVTSHGVLLAAGQIAKAHGTRHNAQTTSALISTEVTKLISAHTEEMDVSQLNLRTAADLLYSLAWLQQQPDEQMGMVFETLASQLLDLRLHSVEPKQVWVQPLSRSLLACADICINPCQGRFLQLAAQHASLAGMSVHQMLAVVNHVAQHVGSELPRMLQMLDERLADFAPEGQVMSNHNNSSNVTDLQVMQILDIFLKRRFQPRHASLHFLAFILAKGKLLETSALAGSLLMLTEFRYYPPADVRKQLWSRCHAGPKQPDMLQYATLLQAMIRAPKPELQMLDVVLAEATRLHYLSEAKAGKAKQRLQPVMAPVLYECLELVKPDAGSRGYEIEHILWQARADQLQILYPKPAPVQDSDMSEAVIKRLTDILQAHSIQFEVHVPLGMHTAGILIPMQAHDSVDVSHPIILEVVAAKHRFLNKDHPLHPQPRMTGSRVQRYMLLSRHAKLALIAEDTYDSADGADLDTCVLSALSSAHMLRRKSI